MAVQRFDKKIVDFLQEIQPALTLDGLKLPELVKSRISKETGFDLRDILQSALLHQRDFSAIMLSSVDVMGERSNIKLVSRPDFGIALSSLALSSLVLPNDFDYALVSRHIGEEVGFQGNEKFAQAVGISPGVMFSFVRRAHADLIKSTAIQVVPFDPTGIAFGLSIRPPNETLGIGNVLRIDGNPINYNGKAFATLISDAAQAFLVNNSI